MSPSDKGRVIDGDIDKIAEMVEQLCDYRPGIIDPIPGPAPHEYGYFLHERFPYSSDVFGNGI
jgi:hypothetical protein